MRLPFVDIYRAPFVEPLGHLAMQAANADNALVGLCLLTPMTLSMSAADVAVKLRQWGPDQQKLVHQWLSGLTPGHDRDSALLAIKRYSKMREERHRAINDSIAVGLEGDDAKGYIVTPLRVSYLKAKGAAPEQSLTEITPDYVADLACRFYDLAKDLEALAYGFDRAD